MLSNKLIVFDTTLRDGAKGAALTAGDKLRIARQLVLLNVDIIEAGFPAASPEDLEALKLLSGEIRNCTLAGLARASADDIEKVAQALEKAESPRIHIFVTTSKAKGSDAPGEKKAEVIQTAVDAIQQARKYFSDVEFSPHDATRLDEEFLVDLCQAAVEAGATTINISDTLGYAVPDPFGRLIQKIKKRVMNPAVISVHCHNDLGMAVANSLAAVQSGARQVECTVNGIGERAGNAALEEIVMALKTRHDIFGIECGIDTTQIKATSDLVSVLMGTPIPENKPIVGGRALDYESGIFRSGFSKGETYEMIKAEDINNK